MFDLDSNGRSRRRILFLSESERTALIMKKKKKRKEEDIIRTLLRSLESKGQQKWPGNKGEILCSWFIMQIFLAKVGKKN